MILSNNSFRKIFFKKMTEKNQNKQEYSKVEILDAIDSCRNEIIRNPEDTALYIKLAGFYELDDNQAEAIHAYQTATKKDPKNLESYYRLGLIYHKEGLHNRAIDSLEMALGLDLKNKKIWNNLGYIHWEKGEWDRARLCYEKALEIEPKDKQTKRNLSALNYLLGKFEIAQDLIQQVFKENKEKTTEDRMQLASCLVALKKYKEASEHYKKALAAQPENAHLLNGFASCLYELGNTKTASSHYKKSLKLEPDNIDFNFNYAEFLYKEGELKEATKLFEKILTQEPEDIETLKYLAECLEEVDTKKSLEFFQKIIKIEPDNIDALKKIAAIQEKHQLSNENSIVRQKIHNLKPNDWENNYELGKIYLEKNKILEAWDLLKYNSKLEKKDTELILRIAENFQFHKDTSNEIDSLRLVIKIDKKHSKAWFRLAEIALENKSFIYAYKYILQSKLWLEGDLLFTQKLVIGLLGINEKEKATELSLYLLASLSIHSALLEPFLKKLVQKNELDYWLEQVAPKLKKLGKNSTKSLDILVVKLREKTPS